MTINGGGRESTISLLCFECEMWGGEDKFLARKEIKSTPIDTAIYIFCRKNLEN